jgi:hypothetical protein
MQKTYREEFMDKAGMLGEGYKYASTFMASRAADFYTKNIMADPNAESRDFITARDHHVGWIAVHHPIGTIGFIAFVSLCLGSIFYVITHIWPIKPSQLTPTQIWSSSLIIQIIFAFFAVFGAMQQFIPQLCILLAIAIISFRPPESQLPTKVAQHPTHSFA